MDEIYARQEIDRVLAKHLLDGDDLDFWKTLLDTCADDLLELFKRLDVDAKKG